jgi:hypothetical protein
VDHQTEFCNLLESPEVKNTLISKDTVLFEQVLSTINTNTKNLMRFAFEKGVQIGEQSAKQAMLEYLGSPVSNSNKDVELVPCETYADLF